MQGSAAQRLTAAFQTQVQWCRTPSPFTARLLSRSLRWLLADVEALTAFDAVAADPLAGAVPLRWAGALHHLALQGRPPWAALWPPAASAASVASAATDGELDAAIAHAWATERQHVQAALANAPQTNEVQRSAALLPGLLFIADATARPLRLLEIGASAGLNLWPERHRYDFGSWHWGAADAALALRCDWRGPAPPMPLQRAPLAIASRAGCDARPIDIAVPDQALRLASYIWPDQTERLARLQVALEEARRWMAASGVAVERESAARFVARCLDQPAPGTATVLVHSVVWQYVGADEQAAIETAVGAAGARATAAAPLAWLRLEPPSDDGTVELRCRLWPGGRDHRLASAHPHAAWVAWHP